MQFGFAKFIGHESKPRRMIDNALRKDASLFRFLQSILVHRLLNGVFCPWPRASCQCRSAIMVRLILDQATARRSYSRVRGSRIQAVARNTSNLEKNTPRLLLFLLAWRSMSEATTDAVVDQLRLLDLPKQLGHTLLLLGHANRLESADQPPLLSSSKLDVL